MRSFLPLASLLVLTAACSRDAQEKNPNQLFFNDFEAIEGWAPATPTLTTERAHSGKYALKTDQNEEYSLGYRNLLGRMSPTRMTKVRLSGWAYKTQPQAAALTLQIVQSEQDMTNVFNQNIDIAAEVKKEGEWTQISKVFELPANIDPANQVRIYLWRAGSTAPTYVDDLALSVEP